LNASPVACNLTLVIESSHLTAFYLFDISETVELSQVSALLQVDAQPARLESKPAMPSYVRYQAPPLHVDGATVGIGPLDGFNVRFKVFDYGVVSLALTRAFAGSWGELTQLAHRLSVEDRVPTGAERLCRDFVTRIHPALREPRDHFLSEDYFVFGVSRLARPLSAQALIDEAGGDIAQLLRAEIEPLSAQEIQEVLRHRLSYLANDLVVPTWTSALVYDSDTGIRAALEIFEYANSQLLQFRYYDELLDDRLARIYKDLETRRGYRSWWLPRRYSRAAREVHALFIDLHELTDRTENALKLVGDAYAARLLAQTHSRLGVSVWRDSVEEKLKTLDEIYRLAVDQTGMERGHLLELAIVAILVFELVLFFMGIMT